MKNRNSSSLHKLPLKYSDSDVKRTADRPRKKSAANLFLQKSAQIIQNYSVLLNKTPYQFGDAEAYFRQTLRNYDDFDFRTFKWESNKSIKCIKSLESFGAAKRKYLSAPSSLGDGDRKDSKLRALHKFNKRRTPELKSKVTREEKVEEEDTDVFYSPSSQLTDNLESLNQKTMAEQEQDLMGFGGEEGEEEGEATTEGATEEDTADPLKETEDLVKRASKDLDKLEEENALTDTEAGPIDTTEEVTGMDMTAGDITEGEITEEDKFESEMTTEPITTTEKGEAGKGKGDSAVLKEVDECEAQCMEIYKILNELRKRVSELLSKSTRSEQEDKELEDKQKLLNEKMVLLEQKTKRIEYLIGQSKALKKETFDKPQTEDMLPKVIICGVTENSMPKIIVCDGKRKEAKRVAPKLTLPSPDVSVMPQFAARLSESYNMQEKLAAENADLEGKRYQLQEDLLNKDQTVESLQRKLNTLQTEMRMIVKENNLLNDKLEKAKICPAPCNKGDSPAQTKPKKMPCGKGKGLCPADIQGRMNEYSETTQQLEKQLTDMEEEVRKMQSELVAVRQERMHLEQHRRMMCTPPPCPTPCSPCSPCSPCPPCPMPPPKPCPGPCNPNRLGGISADQQLRELREQYNALQDDYKGKLTEVAGLRADVEKLKQNAIDAEEAKKLSEEKSKECERLLKETKLAMSKLAGSKEQLVELEQQLSVAKQRYREAKDELEEVKALIEDQKAQLDDYRNKYLQAQQQVEEQRRQIDMMELENGRIGEQVNLEIQRVKNQFQEKLQELTPLPDILKATQLKLQEAQQMHLLAERNNESLVRELQSYRDKAAAMANQMEKVKSDQQLGADEKMNLLARCEEWERKSNELAEENDKLKTDLLRLEEVAAECEKRAQEKMHEIAQLSAEVENVREESARQVARTKDRCETIRRSMQNQIADLERQLAQSRAQARTAQKDRDEIRQKMQAQINNLNENFEDAQMRIRNLQGHVNFLKNSYTNVFPSEPNNQVPETIDPCNCATKF